jgi:hypothetical protein
VRSLIAQKAQLKECCMYYDFKDIALIIAGNLKNIY